MLHTNESCADAGRCFDADTTIVVDGGRSILSLLLSLGPSSVAHSEDTSRTKALHSPPYWRPSNATEDKIRTSAGRRMVRVTLTTILTLFFSVVILKNVGVGTVLSKHTKALHKHVAESEVPRRISSITAHKRTA
jgi:hypothetical protein